VSILVRFNNLGRLIYMAACCATYASACPSSLSAMRSGRELGMFNLLCGCSAANLLCKY
jgi:hypothetical protein